MLRILADHDVEGQVQVLVRICMSAEWAEIWEGLNCRVESFELLGLSPDTDDSKIWQLCQEMGIVLVTGNRNAEGESSLEVTIRDFGTNKTLPVLTIADAKRLLKDREYARGTAVKLMERLFDLESIRGTGRLFIP
jgi:hypothetical protein